MSSKFMKKDIILREIIDKILSVSELGLIDDNDLATKSGILPNTLAQAIRRNTLGKENVMKIHDALGVGIDFLKQGKEPIIVKKGTYVDKRSAIESKVNEAYDTTIAALREIIEDKKVIIQDKLVIIIFLQEQLERCKSGSKKNGE
jgi:transcriptional regulator with XRE-family HTH domain